ncbi:MAG: hypothetical protein OXB84_00845 [Halobacteriovoraceae bacterium]|nr:hypothetical protein [Halobacteriovoraceae bacterium]
MNGLILPIFIFLWTNAMAGDFQIMEINLSDRQNVEVAIISNEDEQGPLKDHFENIEKVSKIYFFNIINHPYSFLFPNIKSVNFIKRNQVFSDEEDADGSNSEDSNSDNKTRVRERIEELIGTLEELDQMQGSEDIEDPMAVEKEIQAVGGELIWIAVNY